VLSVVGAAILNDKRRYSTIYSRNNSIQPFQQREENVEASNAESKNAENCATNFAVTMQALRYPAVVQPPSKRCSLKRHRDPHYAWGPPLTSDKLVKCSPNIELSKRRFWCNNHLYSQKFEGISFTTILQMLQVRNPETKECGHPTTNPPPQ
jgi:hypothetical protein